jgi:Holliday junction DNA helicase RuvA
MIGRLTGRVADCSPGEVLLDVAGVGYSLQIPLSTYYTLSESSRKQVSLHVHTHVREDALQLFGFASREERTAFEMLIGISGIGPRVALAILSGIGVAELAGAVEAQDHGRLERIPGVGKKTAERVLLELRDKMGERARTAAGRGAAGPSAGGAMPPPGAGERLRYDALSALTNLGYTRDRAVRAVDDALGGMEEPEEVRLETLLKSALARIR